MRIVFESSCFLVEVTEPGDPAHDSGHEMVRIRSKIVIGADALVFHHQGQVHVMAGDDSILRKDDGNLLSGNSVTITPR